MEQKMIEKYFKCINDTCSVPNVVTMRNVHGIKKYEIFVIELMIKKIVKIFYGDFNCKCGTCWNRIKKVKWKLNR